MAELNETIHQPVRLRIMAALSALGPGDRIDFATLRDLLHLTDGNLGAHLSKLEQAGYVSLKKTFRDRKPHTTLAITARGRANFEEHVAALRSLLGG